MRITGLLPKGAHPKFPYPTAPIAIDKAINFTIKCRDLGIEYGLGAKADLSDKPEEIKAIDCSGFIRWLVYQASNGAVKMPDGSVVQHEACEASGLKKSTPGAGCNRDNILRIAFLSPKDGGGVGHVVLILNGWTLESHGGRGPDRREWVKLPWASKTSVYVLALP